MTNTMRYIALSDPARPPPPGHCPACDEVMDDAGCRLGRSGYGLDPKTGEVVVRVDEVFCRRTPTHPMRPCPACAAKERAP